MTMKIYVIISVNIFWAFIYEYADFSIYLHYGYFYMKRKFKNSFKMDFKVFINE
jgi:hypothetical protein